MPTSIRRGDQHASFDDSLPHLEPVRRRRACEEEVAGRARERTNAYGTTPPPLSGRVRAGYASRELERLARGLGEQAVALRKHGETSAAVKLERTSNELVALAQAMAANHRG